MTTPTLPAPGTVPEIPAEPINGVQPWQRPSKPLAPLWPPWGEWPPVAVPKATRHRCTLGMAEYELLAEALWPNRGPEVTFEMLLERARMAAALKAAEQLCEIYFVIGARAIGEDELRRLRDEALAQQPETVLNL